MSDEGPAVTAVTFDYWNTLCREPPGGYLRGRRLEAMSQVMVDAGVGSAGVVLPGITSVFEDPEEGPDDVVISSYGELLPALGLD